MTSLTMKMPAEVRRRFDPKLKIWFTPLYFSGYEMPNGWLNKSAQCHACFYYSLVGKSTYDELIRDPLVLVGEKDPTVDLWILFKNIAKLYDVIPEEMGRQWSAVRMQWQTLEINILPEKYQFANTPYVIKN